MICIMPLKSRNNKQQSFFFQLIWDIKETDEFIIS